MYVGSNSRVSVVYFIQQGEDGPIKIGRVQLYVVERRIKTLQIGNPQRLHLRRLVRGDADMEAELHRVFRSTRIRADGEWFSLSPELEHVVHDVGTTRSLA
jgi:hypothetical protein